MNPTPSASSLTPRFRVEVPPGWTTLRTQDAARDDDLAALLDRVRSLGPVPEDDLRDLQDYVTAQIEAAAASRTPLLAFAVDRTPDGRLFLASLALTTADTSPAQASHEMVVQALTGPSEGTRLYADTTFDTGYGPAILTTTAHEAAGLIPLSVTTGNRIFQAQAYAAIPRSSVVAIVTVTVNQTQHLQAAEAIARRVISSFTLTDGAAPGHRHPLWDTLNAGLPDPMTDDSTKDDA